jgi:hypothetical protein
MNKKLSIDELQSYFNNYEEKMKLFIEREIEKGIDKAIKKINDRPPKVIVELIDAGQLEQKMTNGKYKPINKITEFMAWLSNYGYEDCLNFKFFKKFIFYKNTEGTIKQYLKPSNFGVKKTVKIP